MTGVLRRTGNVEADIDKGKTMWRLWEGWSFTSKERDLEQSLPSWPSEGNSPATPKSWTSSL